MKIKKVLLSLLLAVFILPCLAILSACGEKTVTGFQVYVDDKLVAENSNVKISTTYGDVLDLADKITVKLVYDDKSTEIITKGTSGYTLTGVPETFNAGTYSLEVGYGDYSSVEITLEIAKKEITKPTIPQTFTYNGAEQSALATSNYYTLTNNTRTNAGTQNVTVALKDKNNCMWADETDTDLTLAWTINKATPAITKAPDSVGIEDGDTLTNDLIQNAIVSTPSTITPTTVLQGTWAWKTENLKPTTTGNQIAVFTPTNENYSAFEVNVNVVIITYIQKPIISGTFTYNGIEQTALEASEYYTITNNTRTNAGTQIVGVALKDKTNYMWADETNTDLSLSWTINKATPVITENPDSVTIDEGDTLTNDLIKNATVSTPSTITPTTTLVGTWAWKTENLKPTTTGNQIAVFTPTDTNYNFIEKNINVTVNNIEKTQVIAPESIVLQPTSNGQYTLLWENYDDNSAVTYTIDVDGTETTGIQNETTTITLDNIKNNHTIKIKTVPNNNLHFSESLWSTLTIGSSSYDTIMNKFFTLKDANKLQIIKGFFEEVVMYEVDNTNQICKNAENYFFVDKNKLIKINNENVSSIGAGFTWSDIVAQQYPILSFNEKIATNLIDVELLPNFSLKYSIKNYTDETNILYCTQSSIDTEVYYTIYYKNAENDTDYIEKTEFCVDNGLITMVNNSFIDGNNLAFEDTEEEFYVHYTNNLQKPSNWENLFNRFDVTVVGGTLTAEYESDITASGNVYSVIEGDIVTLTPIIPNGQTWDKWTFGNEEITTQNYQTPIRSNITFTANFAGNSQGVLSNVGLSGISGITDETFNYWTANNDEFTLENAELTETQFNALIAQLNSIYNIGNAPLSPWTNDTHYDPSDIKGITNHNLTTNDFIYSYINNTSTNEYFITVLAYRLNDSNTIHIQAIKVKVNEMKITYTNNSNEEDKLVLMFNSEFDAGTATWGELNGTFTIDLENKGLLNINFGENSATGTIDPNNAHILFSYLTTPYEFTKENKGFDFIDEDTQLGFYDIYNLFITNKKIKLEMNFSDSGYTNKYVISEWQEGTNSYISTQITLYTENKDGEPIFLKTYEEIYDITNENVYIFYTERTFMPNNPYNYYYKELTFTDFATKLQTLDSTFETMELWIEDSKISPMFFANFMTKGTWTEQDFIDNLNNVGKINIDNVWYNVETYNTEEGETSLFIKDGKLAILEGDIFSFPTFSFTNPKISKTERENSSNIQYVDWEDTAFNEYFAELYAVE